MTPLTPEQKRVLNEVYPWIEAAQRTLESHQQAMEFQSQTVHQLVNTFHKRDRFLASVIAFNLLIQLIELSLLTYLIGK